MKVQIELGFNWEVGKLGLNEIVYKVDELADEVLKQVVQQLAEAYQEEVVGRLRPGHPSSERAGLGRHEHKGEPGLDDFLAGTVEGHQRCTWHAPRGLYHAMWEDGHGKKQSRKHEDEVARIVAIEIPEGEYDQLDPEAIEAVRGAYRTAKKDMGDLIEVLHQKECPPAVEYLKNLVKGMFAQVEMWLATGIVAPKTPSRLERLFRELGRHLKRIAWGGSDKVATKLSKMILIKQYRPEVWKKYWLKKMGIEGHLTIWVQSVSVASGLNI
jgi:hypothetical protein